MLRNHPKLRKTLLISVGAVALFIVGFTAHHYYQRYGSGNLAVVVEGEVYRSAQPTAGMLREWHDDYKLKAVINLRGKRPGAEYDAETETARELGLKHYDVRFAAERMPPPAILHKLVQTIEMAPRPFLIHCRQGVDRTGMASVLCSMAIGGLDYETAKGQLSLHHLYSPIETAGIIELFEEYEEHCRKEKVDTGDWESFRDWALNVYTAYYYALEWEVPSKIHGTVGMPTEVQVKMTNRSLRPIPADEARLRMYLIAVPEGRRFKSRKDLVGGMALPAQAIAPGESVTLPLTLVPWEVGRQKVVFDVIEYTDKWFRFSARGSKAGRSTVVATGE